MFWGWSVGETVWGVSCGNGITARTEIPPQECLSGPSFTAWVCCFFWLNSGFGSLGLKGPVFKDITKEDNHKSRRSQRVVHRFANQLLNNWEMIRFERLLDNKKPLGNLKPWDRYRRGEVICFKFPFSLSPLAALVDQYHGMPPT